MSSIADLRGCAEKHLADYTDPSGPRAFNTYDRQGDADALAPVDCLAPVFLSVGMRHRHVIPMFQPDGRPARLRAAMQAVLDDPECRVADFLDIDLKDDPGPWAKVRAALRATKGVRGVKAGIVTKILHRKRPTLVPVYDSEVYRFYVGKKPTAWSAPAVLWPRLQADLREQRRWLVDLAHSYRTPDERPLSKLRAADIVVWEHQVTGCRGPR